jgi:hypothetical protein
MTAMMLPLRQLSTVAAVAVVAEEDTEPPPNDQLFSEPGISALIEIPAGGLSALARDPLPQGVVVVIAFESDDDAVQFERDLAEIRGEIQ